MRLEMYKQLLLFSTALETRASVSSVVAAAPAEPQTQPALDDDAVWKAMAFNFCKI